MTTRQCSTTAEVTEPREVSNPRHNASSRRRNHPPTATEEIDSVALIAATTHLTFPINGAGLSALAHPGHLAYDGLPVGLQLIGPPGSDWHLLVLGSELERLNDTTSVHDRGIDQTARCPC